MKRIVAISVGILILATPLPVEAFHELECGPFRTTIIDDETGRRTCLALSPDAQKLFLRTRKLQQEQARRTRDLLLKQRQRAKKQELITRREQNKQQQFNRSQTLRQRQPALERDQAIKLQEGLKRQEAIRTRRRELLRESDLERQRKLLEQQVKLPGADLLDSQKALKRRLEKDQLK